MGNRIKITFNDEHIALIKAMQTERIDLDSVFRSFNSYDKKYLVLKCDANDDNKVSEFLDTVEHSGFRHAYDEMTVGEIMERNHICIDSIYGIDAFNMFGGTFQMEQMALILGLHDQCIEQGVNGPRYPKEVEEHLLELAAFMQDNIQNIEEILHQFCTEGIQAGVTYWCLNYQHIWYKEEK